MYLWPQTSSMWEFEWFHYGVMTRASDGCVPRGIKQGYLWAMDNEAFTRGFDFERWKGHWQRLAPYSKRCMFVVVPDVVGDARATLDMWREWSGRIKAELDYYDNLRHVRKPWMCLAYVAQDGSEALPFPDEAQWIFIGGSTEWKLSAAADDVVKRAQRDKLWVHVGRVNSQKRWRHFQFLDVDSMDGTGPCREPDNFKRLFDALFPQWSLFS